ncbi:MAG: ROK family protein [Verrucomicrobiales bacterium]
MINAPLSLPTDTAPCIGFDLGGTKCMPSSSVPAVGTRLPAPRDRKLPRRGKGIEHMIETIEQALVDASVRAEDLACIGVGCPGVVELDTGVLHSAPNLGWSRSRSAPPCRSALACRSR